MKEIKFIIPENGEKLSANADELHEELLKLPAEMYVNSISGAVGDFNQWFDITMNVSNDIVFGSKYNMRGERTYDKVPRKQE